MSRFEISIGLNGVSVTNEPAFTTSDLSRLPGSPNFEHTDSSPLHLKVLHRLAAAGGLELSAEKLIQFLEELPSGVPIQLEITRAE